MNATTTEAKPTVVNVGMGQIEIVESDGVARSILGSCIGLVLYHQARRVAAVGHIVLPECGGRPGPAGKFADTAIPAMIESLAGMGAGKPGLIAKLAGGANMFGSSGPIQIGESNYAAVSGILAEIGIPLVAEHIGGSQGRRITVETSSGEVAIEMAGQERVVI